VSTSAPVGEPASPLVEAKLKAERNEARVKLAGAVIIALLTCLTAAIGIFAANKANQANESISVASAVSSSAAVAQTQNSAELQAASSQIESLKSVVSSLQAAPAQTTGDTGATAPVGTVRHTGRVTLTSDGDGINLDAPADDPIWSGSPDVKFWSNTDFIPGTGAEVIALTATPSAPIDINTCRVTGYTASQIQTSAFSKGLIICVHTDQKRYAVLQVESASPASLVFDVTTYDPPIS